MQIRRRVVVVGGGVSGLATAHFLHQAAGGRLDRIDRGLRLLPGLHVTGAAYRGVGLASCIGQARQTVHELLAQMSTDLSSRQVLA